MADEIEIKNKIAQFHRILMSYVDFQQAYAIATLILAEDLHSNYPKKDRIKLEGLNSAMVVAYCRPFSGNKGVPDLPGRFVKHLTVEEKEMHKELINDRNTLIAHSSSNAWNLRPHFAETDLGLMLLPIHHGVQRPFLKESTIVIQSLAEKQREACFEERRKFEKELKDYIPRLTNYSD